MRVLIAFGSKHGSTAGLAQMIAEALELRDIGVDVRPAGDPGSLAGYDAVIVAGSLYANRWHRDARRFVRRNAKVLRTVPVWLLSSGPLDDSASSGAIAPVGQVAKLVAAIGARRAVTFGGRLAPDVTGFPARAMAKAHAGDWRDPDQVSAFAADVATGLGKIDAMRS